MKIVTISTIIISLFVQQRVFAADSESHGGGSLRGKQQLDIDYHQQSNRTLGIFDSHQRIVGGEVASPGDYPYYVDLNGCGGSLIAPNVVLTAAHCGSFTGKNVIVGAFERGKTTYGAQRVQVTAQKRHPNYNDSTLRNDLLLLKLERPVALTTDIQFSINDSKNLAGGEDLDVLGLGLTSENGNNLASKLRDVTVQAVPTSTCNGSRWYAGGVHDATMFCAGVSGGGKDSCQGDSGGPIVRRSGNTHVQVGVVSWGEGCARARKPGVYSRVSSAHGWIKGVVCNTWNSDATFCDGDGGGGGGGGGGTNNCPSGQIEFDWTVTIDGYGGETSWILKNSAGKRVLRRGRNMAANRTYRTVRCIPKDTYKLIIRDSYGDGLCCGGTNPGYTLKVDGVIKAQKGRINFKRGKRVATF